METGPKVRSLTGAIPGVGEDGNPIEVRPKAESTVRVFRRKFTLEDAIGFPRMFA
jgi:hypothetical protein